VNPETDGLDRPEREAVGGWRSPVFIFAVVVGLALVGKLLLTPEVGGLLVSGIIAALVASVVGYRIGDITAFEGFGVKAQLRDVNQKIDVLLAISMSRWQIEHLAKLASGRYGRYEKGRGLENDLRHLRDHGYIYVDRIGDIPSRGEDLSEYVEITDAGREFLRLRRS
jgi:hypothetical protein